MKWFTVYLVGILATINVVNCANILMLLGMASPSHHIWFRTLIYGLAENGHNITAVSTDIEKKPPSNVTYIHYETVYQSLYGNPDNSFDMVALIDQSPFIELQMYGSFCDMICEEIFKSNGHKQIMNYPDDFKFDLVIYDYTCGPCLLFLLKKFNYPPMIGATPFSNPPFTVDVVGGHRQHAYIPFYGLPYTSNMNFLERSYNVIVHLYSHFYRKYYFVGNQDKIARKYLNMDFPHLEDLEKKTLLAFVNTNPAIDFPEAMGPNVIPVGGLQIKEPKELPKNLEDFINSSEKGAVLMSLGTNIQSSQLGAETQIKILNAFAKMPQYNFMWKFEIDSLPIQPTKNVLISKWLPQNDILGHPKIKAFITHSGGLSTLETSWHGVPIIGIPFFVDQHRNMRQSLKAGVGEKITFMQFTTDEFVDKVLRVIEVPIYREKMQLRSQRFKDQKEKPLDRAIWWVNWVLRNPNPDHIQSPVKQLGFFKANSLDVVLSAVGVVLFLVYLIVKLITCTRKKLLKKQKAE